MARFTSLSCNHLPSLSSSATTSKPAKLASNLFSTLRFRNKPIQLISDAPQVRKTFVVRQYGGRRGMDFDDDDEVLFEEGNEERGDEGAYDPNLDLDRIESPTVRLLDEQNTMIGVMPLREAVRRSLNSDLLLAIISAQADPPVLRLFEENEYKKHKFEKQKKQKVQQKKSGTRLKEVKLGLKIGTHDYSVRLKQGKKFIKEGQKVKVIVNMKGKDKDEMSKEIGIELLRQFQADLSELATEESKNFEERNIHIILSPKKANVQREEQSRRREEQLKKKELEETEETGEAMETEETEEAIETEETVEMEETEEKEGAMETKVIV